MDKAEQSRAAGPAYQRGSVQAVGDSVGENRRGNTGAVCAAVGVLLPVGTAV